MNRVPSEEQNSEEADSKRQRRCRRLAVVGVGVDAPKVFGRKLGPRSNDYMQSTVPLSRLDSEIYQEGSLSEI